LFFRFKANERLSVVYPVLEKVQNSDIMQSGFAHQPQVQVGDKVLKIERNLGNGAFGVVYKVKDERTLTDYALKDILCFDNSEYRDAIREVQTLNQIAHENVISVKAADQFQDSGGFHILILTEYCAGGNLNKRLARPSSDLENFKWMRQCAAALAFLHSRGVVHRDLKADNVLLTAAEDVKLADFGLAREYIALKTDARRDDGSWLTSYPQYFMNSKVGTVHWMAPEVFRGNYTEKADVFSLGAIFYAILERDFITIDGEKLYGAFTRPLFGRKIGIGYVMATDSNKSIRVSFSRQAQGSKFMQSITIDALQYDEKDRPSAAEVHEKIENLAAEINFWMKEGSRAYCPIS